jgi:pyruvate,water dikinase
MVIKGKAKIIKIPKDYCQIEDEVIIVVENTTPDIVIVINKVIAIITEIDNKLCHAAIIAREYNKPIVMGVADATRKYKNGDFISINTITKKVC